MLADHGATDRLQRLWVACRERMKRGPAVCRVPLIAAQSPLARVGLLHVIAIASLRHTLRPGGPVT